MYLPIVSGDDDHDASATLRCRASGAMEWRTGLPLLRVLGLSLFGIETCEQCGGGKVKVIASIEDPTVIGQILGHLASRALPAGILGGQT